jgi:hypothetical protein
MEDFTPVTNRLLREAESSAHIAVYAAIAFRRVYETANAEIGSAEVVRLARVSKPTALAAINWLAAHGILEIGDGSAHSPTFEFAKINLVPALYSEPFLPAVSMPATAQCDPFGDLGKSSLVDMSEATFTKSADSEFHKFTQFTKLQETGDGDVVVFGIATHEKPDLDGETCDYESAKSA